MSELKLPHAQIMTLRASAHGLDPVVLLGAAGLSDAVLREIDRALRAHELIKVRAGRIDAQERDGMFLSVAERLGAARIQSIGHTFVLYRPAPATPAPRQASKESTRKPARKAAKKAPTRRPATGKARVQR
jgi:putative YhbY family RNA-binding protein